MPIIFEMGKFHIEQHNCPITILDAADDYASASISLVRGGNVVGATAVQTVSISGTNDNLQACGVFSVLDAGFGQLTYGEFLTAFRMTVHKVAGTSGSTNISYSVLLFIRDKN